MTIKQVSAHFYSLSDKQAEELKTDIETVAGKLHHLDAFDVRVENQLIDDVLVKQITDAGNDIGTCCKCGERVVIDGEPTGEPVTCGRLRCVAGLFEGQ